MPGGSDGGGGGGGGGGRGRAAFLESAVKVEANAETSPTRVFLGEREYERRRIPETS